MKLSFRSVDFDRLAAFWNSFYPERYRIDADLLQLKTVQCPVFDWGASYVEQADGETLGFVIVKKSAGLLYPGLDRDQANLSAIGYCDANFGVDLLADLKRLLRNRGCTRLVFGQDSDHFFPGCPEDFPSLINFLTVEGFAPTGVSNDLERDLADYENPYATPEGDELRLMEAKDIPALEEFFEREFPHRWRYDVMRKIEADGPGCVFGLFHGDRVDGFALIQQSGHKCPIGGAVWHNDLGENWGSLGPIGVSAALRGKGSGHALLGNSLTHLKNAGVRRCIIDWTGLVEFYGRHGFEVTRRYRSMVLDLPE
ncbi:GNAT family N-acetyltransferase [Fimbriimonas ginsengisoli]|uniref:Putative acetyltransferase n=1 Tax=Fimbriimonas ginsengisoli Gsoil 348 TaxID=661478 RepID=A0A068NIW9_FIMGI|nr:GNAT family N-acetyltransferase [Fimbriimonas ginsengisoli]AIE83466.1 putative acetyltransferase [Fimbriimonas ginsengisoli Gsoil 348]